VYRVRIVHLLSAFVEQLMIQVHYSEISLSCACNSIIIVIYTSFTLGYIYTF